MSRAGPTPSAVTPAQITSAVHGSEHYPCAVRRHHLDQVVGLVLQRLAMAALGNGTAVDLGNGFALICTLQPIALEAAA
jgi:hypothetical protein